MWALVMVMVSLDTNQPDVDVVWSDSYLTSLHQTMADCFEGREDLLVDSEQYDGHFQTGVQAVCVRLE